VIGTHLGMKKRAAAAGLVALGLTLYGLLGGGSSAVPFTGKSVSTVPTDRFAVSSTRDINGNNNVVAMGPNHSLYSYWQIGGTWHGPLQIGGAGTAYSAPGITAENNLDVAVEGPSHTLLFFWQINSTWYGPLQIGAPGSTFSAPAIKFDVAGSVDVTAQGPNGSIYFYWGINGVWKGPLGIAGPGTTFSAPSIGAEACGGGTHNCVDVAAKGPANEALNYFAMDGSWTAPSTSGQNQEYSAPSYTNFFTMGGWTEAYQGPGNSLIYQESQPQGGSNTYCVLAGAGTAYSAPGMFAGSSTGSGGGFTSFSVNIGVDGPSNSLYVFWSQFDTPTTRCNGFYGPLQLSGAGSTFSVPSVQTIFDGTILVTNMYIEGPSHTLYEFWSDNGTWFGPLQIGGIGTTFDSST
jgi:hypothetical protein